MKTFFWYETQQQQKNVILEGYNFIFFLYNFIFFLSINKQKKDNLSSLVKMS